MMAVDCTSANEDCTDLGSCDDALAVVAVAAVVVVVSGICAFRRSRADRNGDDVTKKCCRCTVLSCTVPVIA